MKKFCLAVLVISTTLLSCSKKEENKTTVGPTGEKFPIYVDVSDFIRKTESLSSSPQGKQSNPLARDSALAAKVPHLYCIISGNGIQKTIHQVATDPNFGTITDSLVAGSYNISVAAATDSLKFSGTIAYTGDGFGNYVAAFPDMFVASSSINVSSSSNNTLNLSLNRPVGQLEVVVLDAPSLDSTVRVFIEDDCNYDFSVGGPIGAAPSARLELPRISKNVFRSIVMNTIYAFRVVVEYQDKTTNQILTKQIQNVSVTANSKTILSGNVYAPVVVTEPAKYQGGFTVSINEAWGNDIYQGF